MYSTAFTALQGGVDVLTNCVGVKSSLTATQVAMLTNAWAELLTTASVNDDNVSYSYTALAAFAYAVAHSKTSSSCLFHQLAASLCSCMLKIS